MLTKPGPIGEELFEEFLPTDFNLDYVDQVHHAYRIGNWKSQPKKLKLPVFECGGSKWYVFVIGKSFPQLNGIGASSCILEVTVQKASSLCTWKELRSTTRSPGLDRVASNSPS